MTDLRIQPYTPAHQQTWNAFAATARNGHFLFNRGFMDYHADRFEDASLLVYDNETLCALLPANRREDKLFSHQGLTFGGFIVDDAMSAPLMLRCFDALKKHMADAGLRELRYKPVPHIYARRPAQEDLYALFRNDAQLIRRDVTTTIDYKNPGPLSKRRQRGVKKAQGAGLVFTQSQDLPGFWQLLIQVLAARHSTAPVHSLEEITLLASRFPDNIRLFTAHDEDALVAGIVMFETPLVAHAQYICVSDEGRACGALDGLFAHVIDTYRVQKSYFDFGISNEQAGRILNEGLVTQKEEFGGSTVVHEEYCLTI